MVGKGGPSGNGEGRKRRGNAVTSKNWQSQWDGGAGLPAFRKSMYFTASRTLVKFSDLQLVFCSPCTGYGLFPKGRGRELPGGALQFTIKTPACLLEKPRAVLILFLCQLHQAF